MTEDHRDHWRALERIYQAAACNEYYRPRLTVSRGRAEVVIPVSPKFFHAAGAVHGSVYFKALDDAAYFAVNSLLPHAFVLTVSFNIYLVRPVSKGDMIARGEVVHQSTNLFLAQSELTDGRGRLLARGSGSFTKSKQRPNLGVQEP